MSNSIPIAHSRQSSYRRLSSDSSFEMSSQLSSPKFLHLRHDLSASVTHTSSTGELSGIYFGILVGTILCRYENIY